ncbi:MAG: HD domain-containing protein [Clostridiales bacterium]|jgi:uncharacterized protein|nr:HD domain-containing protein [Clostridiales bacterium]MDR2713785.1 HD domain-containing protein [Clostridiales bacterium]
MEYGKYQNIVEFMEECMQGDISNRLHTYRVLNYALQILETEASACREVVIVAALLHDIGHKERRYGRKIPGDVPYHAKVGSEKSYGFLIGNGYEEEIAKHVADCIFTHSLNSKIPPKTLEAKIVFDADKLDLTGAMGAVRTALSGAAAGEPLYLLDGEGIPSRGKKKEDPSLLRDYQQQLKKLLKVFNTAKAQKIAAKQQKTMDLYFEELLREVGKNHKNGNRLAQKYCREKAE